MRQSCSWRQGLEIRVHWKSLSAALLTLLAHDSRDTEASGDFFWALMPEGAKVLGRREALSASRPRNSQDPRAVAGCQPTRCVASHVAVVQLLDTTNIKMYRIQLSNPGMNALAFKEKLICN